jgi:hypothetical protein
MPSFDCVHLSTDYVNSSVDRVNTFVNYIDFSIDFTTKSDVCVNTLMIRWIFMLI